ncbi:globin domain-containing protein [Deinococcus sp. YIM 77859]|uniref:globin domain-containing protein n=1 Tax=Deinococcus sp. YIM 77859 TaxID=1540221 RepID=UPI00350E498D
MLNIFNPANQKTGRQARRLAASVLAYAANIDRPELLGGMVERIAHKHVSLEVLPEHYPIVGEHLLKAIAAVLGEAATPEILDA